MVSIVLSSSLLAFFMLSVVSAAQQAQPTTQTQPVQPTQTPHKRPAKKVQKPAPEPPPEPPPPPPTPEQMPALPPQVRYSRGQLTIVAENSTLADILRAVRTQTGAVVEVPPNATERVVTHLGPGPAREILAALLNGSHFNYVMMGSAAHPDSVERLILTSKSGGTPPPVVPVPPPQRQGDNEGQMDDPGATSPDTAEQTVEDAGENAGAENPPQPNGQQPVKTPEQLLRELQQQQQVQQQQQQQQQPQPAPGAPPPQGGPN